MEPAALYRKARTIAENAYAPYSRFRVGAALLCADGTVFTGVNVENRSYGLTICAERVAIGIAVTHGHRQFTAIAICTPDAASPVPPCGACRQVISEFSPQTMPVYYGNSAEEHVATTIGALYPQDSLHDLREQQDS
jgi:cytidine deaminase